MFRVLLFQICKHQIHLILKFLVILPNLHSVHHLHQSGKILFLLRGFIVDIADERRIKQRLSLDPEIIPGLALALGVGN